MSSREEEGGSKFVSSTSSPKNIVQGRNPFGSSPDSPRGSSYGSIRSRLLADYEPSDTAYEPIERAPPIQGTFFEEPPTLPSQMPDVEADVRMRSKSGSGSSHQSLRARTGSISYHDTLSYWSKISHTPTMYLRRLALNKGDRMDLALRLMKEMNEEDRVMLFKATVHSLSDETCEKLFSGMMLEDFEGFENDIKDVVAKDSGGCSTFSATVAIMKLVVGIASYALPKAFSLAGLYGGLVTTPIMSILCALSITLLVRCKQSFAVPRDASYTKIIRVYCGRYGNTLSVLLNMAMVVASIGACASYIDFTSPLITSVLGGSHIMVVLCTLPAFILLSFIRDFKYLAFTSILGEISFVIAIVTLFWNGFETQEIHTNLPLVNWAMMPHFFGAASFLFAIALFILPVEQAMEKPEEFTRAVYTAFSITTVINMIVGTLGFLLWGEEVQDVIVNNMTPGSFTTMVKALLVIDISFSFPIVLAPAREFLEICLIRGGDDSSARSLVSSYFLRAIVVVLCASIAILMPNFLDVVSMVGGLSLITTTMVLPPLLYIAYKRFEGRDNVGFWITFGNVSLSFVGCATAAAAVYSGIAGVGSK